MRKQIIIFFITLCGGINSSFAQKEKLFSRDELKVDLAYLKSKLEKNHPGL
jgi:hypothetical protein